jgi:hypothetical protein
MRRREFGNLTVGRRLSVLEGILSLASLSAAIVGAAEGRVGLVVLGFGLFLFFGIGSWWISPWRIRHRT